MGKDGKSKLFLCRARRTWTFASQNVNDEFYKQKQTSFRTKAVVISLQSFEKHAPHRCVFYFFYFFVMLPCSTEETKEVCNDSFALYESIACCNKAEPNCLGVYFVCHNPYAKEPGTELISFTYNVPSQTR